MSLRPGQAKGPNVTLGIPSAGIPYTLVVGFPTSRVAGRATAAVGALEALQLISTNGMAFTYTSPALTLTIDTPQDIRTSASPSFLKQIITVNTAFDYTNLYSSTYRQTLVSTDGNAILLNNFSTDTVPSRLTYYKARGTQAAPADVAASDYLGYVVATARVGGAGTQLAALTFNAQTTTTGRFGFITKNVAGALREHIWITNEGFLVIGKEPMSVEAWTAGAAGGAPSVAVIQLGGVGALWCNNSAEAVSSIAVSSNIYYDGAYKRMIDAKAVLHFASSGSGDFSWYSDAAAAPDVGFTPTERMRLTSAGVLVVGKSPLTVENWSTSYAAMQVGGLGCLLVNSSEAVGSAIQIGNNFYFDGAYKRMMVEAASTFIQYSGIFYWGSVASAAADAAFTWTTRMQLNLTGELWHGTDVSTNLLNARIMVYNTSTDPCWSANRFAADGVPCRNSYLRSRGTQAVPADLNAGDYLQENAMYGRIGGANVNVANLSWILNATTSCQLRIQGYASSALATWGFWDINGIEMTVTTMALYFGPVATDGSWRIIRDGDDLSFQRRESGTYVEKGAFTAV